MTDELARRPSREPDHAAENRALIALAEAMTGPPLAVLQRLVTLALELCRTDSAGVSILEEDDDGRELFRWHAVAGLLGANVGHEMPRGASPCGTVLDRDSLLLFSHPGRHFPFARFEPPVVEALLIPFHAGDKPIGTVWVVSHSEGRTFDAEDARLIKSLSGFASTAAQAIARARRARRTDALLGGQKRVLERIARSEPLPAVLAALCRLVEEQADGPMSASVDLPGARLHPGGSQPDWSTPIVSPGGEILGTLAVDFCNARHPTRHERQVVEVLSRTAALADERLRAEEADRRKEEFLAMLGHELRNPLASISNAVELLRSVGGPDSRVRYGREVIERQVQQLTRLVDDLLEASRVSQGKITLKKTTLDLADVMTRAVEVSRPLLDARGHRLTVSLPRQPLSVDADPARLAQVLGNLLHNAAKYTPKGGEVTLSAAREGDEAVVRLRDTGVGIAAELLPSVFEMFFQADRSLDRSQGGLGIGLALVKRLVELHGGRVEAHSDGAGQGSEMVLRLPVLEEPAGAAARPPASPAGPPRRILVVDDNRDSADTLAMLLELEGHEVQTAYDGPEALAAASAFDPEVVLLDIGLPEGISGHDVARELRRNARSRAIQLIAMTGYGQEEDRRLSREAGFDAHLVKPADLAILQRLLDRKEQTPG